MTVAFRPASIVFGAVLFVAAAPAADLQVPQVDLSKPHGLPAASRCAQASGTAVIAVHVNELGKPFEVQTDKSSGCAALDESGEFAVKSWRFLPATRDGDPIAEWTAVGFQYDGKVVTQVDVPPETAVAQQDRDRVICKTQKASTGSHIDPGPVCMSKAQWEERRRQAEEARKREHIPTKIGTTGPTGTSY